MLISLVVDLVGYFPLSELKSEVPDAHQRDIYKQCNDWEVNIYLIVHLREVDHDCQQDSQQVLKMNDGINDEIPDTYEALVPIGKDLVVVHWRVGDYLNHFPALERHLFFQELVFHLRVPPFLAEVLFFEHLLITYLIGVLCEARSEVICLIQARVHGFVLHVHIETHDGLFLELFNLSHLLSVVLRTVFIV